jgi:hypothetical protein
MGYVIAALLVVVIVTAFVALLMRNATRKSNLSDAGDPGADQNPLGIVGSDDETPLGDTREHADIEREPRFKHASERNGAAAAPAVDGGEAEGRRSLR